MTGLPGLIINPCKLAGAACMQAVLEKVNGHMPNVACLFMEQSVVVTSISEVQGKSSVTDKSSILHVMQQTTGSWLYMRSPSQSRCLKMTLSHVLLSEAGPEAVACSIWS